VLGEEAELLRCEVYGRPITESRILPLLAGLGTVSLRDIVAGAAWFGAARALVGSTTARLLGAAFPEVPPWCEQHPRCWSGPGDVAAGAGESTTSNAHPVSTATNDRTMETPPDPPGYGRTSPARKTQPGGLNVAGGRRGADRSRALGCHAIATAPRGRRAPDLGRGARAPHRDGASFT